MGFVYYGHAPIPLDAMQVYSVGSMLEAHRLVVLTCPLGQDGIYYSRELQFDQTIENLEAFRAKVHYAHAILVEKGQCECIKSGVGTGPRGLLSRRPNSKREAGSNSLHWKRWDRESLRRQSDE